MQKWLVRSIIILAFFLISVIFLIYMINKNDQDLFNKYYNIKNDIFKTVEGNDIKMLIKNKSNGLIFIAEKKDVIEATVLYKILNQNEIGLAYFLAKDYQRDNYLAQLLNYKLTYPVLIGLKNGKIIEVITNINELNVISLVNKVYDDIICTNNC